jgi:catechol 2,3-dioxygenase-like lactoylglutathione lyase family enzyme
MKNVDHIAILVENLEVSQEWYEKHCQAKLIFKDEKYRRMQMGNTTIALISKNHYKHAHIGLLVHKYSDLPSNLGEIVHHRDGTTGCYVMDPDGNMVEFIHYNDECKKKMGIKNEI